jgi:hypothetical protein
MSLSSYNIGLLSWAALSFFSSRSTLEDWPAANLVPAAGGTARRQDNKRQTALSCAWVQSKDTVLVISAEIDRKKLRKL